MTPLFIVGAPRSGTTLARNILRGLKGVYLPPDEFQFLPAFVRHAENGASPEDLARMVNETVFAKHMRRRGIWPDATRLVLALEGKSPADAFRAVILLLAEEEGVDPVLWWGDKTPKNVFQLDTISRLWPDAHVLNVVRDPRSTVFSMHRSWGRSFVRGAVVWRDAIRAAERFGGRAKSARMQTLSYEKLTEDPEDALESVADWLGVPFSSDAFTAVSSEERWGRSAGVKGVQKRQSDWKTFLAEDEARLIEEICYDEMVRAGFEPEFAQAARRPGKLTLGVARVRDAARGVQFYARERGIRDALSYKLRQWRSARM